MTDERTNEQISAEIAERLFGLVQCDIAPRGFHPADRAYPCVDWDYVSFDGALGLVVPEMRRRGYEFASMDRNGEFRCSFYQPKSNIPDVVIGVPFGEEPRAICLAALLALDAERKAE